MTARLLIEVALRVMGLWSMLSAIENFSGVLSIYLSNTWAPPTSSMLHAMVATAGGKAVFQSGLAAALIYWAPAIAARLYPPDAHVDGGSVHVGAGDLYRIACFALGAYVFVLAVEPAARLIVYTFRGGPVSVAVDAGMTLLYLGAGTFLVFGSQRLSSLLSNLYYDPDTIPKQRFSLAILLVVIVLFAIFLTVMRRLAPSGG